MLKIFAGIAPLNQTSSSAAPSGVLQIAQVMGRL